jgi:O-antigen ligase
MPLVDSKLRRESTGIERQSLFFVFSAFVFRIGLALVTFEQVRPLGIQFSDYLFFLSIFLVLFSPGFHWLKSIRSGIPFGGGLIICGALLSLLNATSVHDAAGPFVRLLVLYGLFAPLALIHSRDIYTNLLFLMAGISANSVIALIQAWIMPGIVDMLSINPITNTGLGSAQGRFQGLTSHPNILGLSVALAVLIGVGLFSSGVKGGSRLWLGTQVAICSLGGIVTGSRTLVAALVPGLLVLVFLQKRNRRTLLRALAALAVIGVAITTLAPTATSLYARRLLSSGEDYSPDYGRAMTAGLAVVEISEKPILGWGVDHMMEAGAMVIPDTSEIGIAHNTFLQYWFAAGLLGAVGFLFLFFTPMRQMLRALKNKTSERATDALSLCLGLYVLLFIVCNVHPIFYNRFVYIPMFALAGFVARLPGPIKVRKAVRTPLVHLPAPNPQPPS